MTIWNLLQRIGYNSSAYDGTSSAEMQPLDPILIATADMTKIRKAAQLFPTLWQFLKRIYEPEVFKALIDKALMRKVVWTNNCYHEHIQQLHEWGLLQKVPIDQAAYFVGYFEVPKGEYASRAIVNAKTLSSHFVRPEPVNIAPITGILERIHHMQSEGPIYIVYGDFRHFFHAVLLHPDIAKHFTIAINHVFYSWVRLPMGWSFSPLTAQALGWLVILHREEGDEALFETEGLAGGHLPTFVRTVGCDGFISLTYDNYICTTRDAGIADKISKRIIANCKRFNITIKEHKMVSSKSMSEHKAPVILLGAQVCHEMRRNEDQPTHGIKWRIDPRKSGMILPLLTTRRQIASAIGRCLYRYHLSLRPLVTCPGAMALIQILRLLALRQIAPCSPHWDSNFPLTDQQTDVLQSEWALYRNNDWLRIEPAMKITASTQRYIVASDASETAWGFVVMTLDGEILYVHSARWADSMSELHIFYLELYAALYAQKWVHKQKGKCIIYHLIDNSAARAVLEHGYSTTTLGCRWLAEHYRIFEGRIHLVAVTSGMNIADEPSRLKDLKLMKIAITCKIVHDAILGFRGELGTPYSSAEWHHGGIRHREPDDDCIDDEQDDG